MEIQEQTAAYAGSIIDPVPTKKQMRSTFGRMGLALALSMVLTQLLEAILMVLPLGIDVQGNSFLIGSLATGLVVLPIVAGLCRPLPTETPKRNSLSFGAFLSLVCISYACMIMGNLVGMGVNLLVSPESMDLVSQLANASGLSVGMVIAFVVLAPVFEELVFRKILVDRALPYGEWPAILLSGLTFGLFHGNLTQFFYATLLGMVLSYVYIRTGNILYSIGLHACINFLGGVVPLLVPEASGAVLLVAVAGVALLIVHWKKIRIEKAKYPGVVAQMFNSGGMIVYILVCGLMMALVAYGMSHPELLNLP